MAEQLRDNTQGTLSATAPGSLNSTLAPSRSALVSGQNSSALFPADGIFSTDTVHSKHASSTIPNADQQTFFKREASSSERESEGKAGTNEGAVSNGDLNHSRYSVRWKDNCLLLCDKNLEEPNSILSVEIAEAADETFEWDDELEQPLEPFEKRNETNMGRFKEWVELWLEQCQDDPKSVKKLQDKIVDSYAITSETRNERVYYWLLEHLLEDFVENLERTENFLTKVTST